MSEIELNKFSFTYQGQVYSFKNIFTPQPAIPTLGETFGGGKIIKVLQAGDVDYEEGKTKVMIMAASDAATCRWAWPSSFDGTFYHMEVIGTTLPDVGQGKENTRKILAVLEANTNPSADNIYATEICKNYFTEGDGFLGSKNEMVLAATLNSTSPLAGFLGTLNSSGYWTSTEDDTNVFFQKLDNSGSGSGSKDGSLGVRPIRIAEYTVTDGFLLKSEAASTYAQKTELTKYMLSSDFVGNTAIKSVQFAETATAAINSAFSSATTSDMLGRVIHETYATIAQLNNTVGSVFRAKGSREDFSSLPTNPANGDVYNLEDTGMNYAYIGDTVDETHPYDSTLWDALGGVTALATLTENGLLSKEDFAVLQNLSITYATKIELSKTILQKMEITGADGISDDSGTITGTTTFNLDATTDFTKVIVAYDGGSLARFTTNSIAKTITFIVAPYTGNIITILYYKL